MLERIRPSDFTQTKNHRSAGPSTFAFSPLPCCPHAWEADAAACGAKFSWLDCDGQNDASPKALQNGQWMGIFGDFLQWIETTFHPYNSHEPRKKKPYYVPLYWLVNRDPYIA